MSKKIRISASFSPAQVLFLDAVFDMLLRGGDERVLLRRPECADVLRTVTSMRRRLEEAKAKQAREPEIAIEIAEPVESVH